MVLKPDKTPLSISHPEIAEEWHPEKNDGVSPNQVVAGTGKKIWWKCSQGPDHEWRVKGADRTGINKSGCPCCNGKKVSVTNSLASKFPNIAVQLHPTKNDGVTADQIIAGSNKKYWWVCSEQPDHEWLTTSGARTGRGTGGPFCAHQKVSPSTSLAFRFPEIAQQWHLSKNGDITPEQIVAGSNIRAWWKCLEGPDHEWQVSAYSRTGASKSGCPYCRSLRVSITNSLSSRSPEIARQWHPTKNNGVTPNQVTAGSHTKYWWKCPVGPDHE